MTSSKAAICSMAKTSSRHSNGPHSAKFLHCKTYQRINMERPRPQVARRSVSQLEEDYCGDNRRQTQSDKAQRSVRNRRQRWRGCLGVFKFAHGDPSGLFQSVHVGNRQGIPPAPCCKFCCGNVRRCNRFQRYLGNTASTFMVNSRLRTWRRCGLLNPSRNCRAERQGGIRGDQPQFQASPYHSAMPARPVRVRHCRSASRYA